MSRVDTHSAPIEGAETADSADELDLDALKASFFSSLHDVRAHEPDDEATVTGYSVPLPRGAPIPPRPADQPHTVTTPAIETGSDDEIVLAAESPDEPMPAILERSVETGPATVAMSVASTVTTISPVRRGIHRVASASAALAVAVILTGIGNAVFDTYNAIASNAGPHGARAVSAPLTGGSLAAYAGAAQKFQSAVNDDAMPAKRLAFVRTAAFEAALAARTNTATTLASSPAENRFALRATPLFEPARAIPSDLASVAPAAPSTPVAAVERAPAMELTTALEAATDDSAARPAKPTLAEVQLPPAVESAAPTSARVTVANAAPAAVSDAAPAVVTPVRIVNAGRTIAAPRPVEAVRTSPAQALSTEVDAHIAPTSWTTEVTPTLHGRRLAAAAAASNAERAHQIRRQAYGLGARSLAPDSNTASIGKRPEIIAPAPERVVETTPWYLKRPEWSPFEGTAPLRN